VRNFRFFCPFVLVCLFTEVSCSPEKAPAPLESPPVIARAAAEEAVWDAVAVLKPGPVALWFEMGELGPELIREPGEASLETFVPWPYARNVTGIQPWGDGLAAGVNRQGFIVMKPGNEGITLYRLYDPPHWDSYTASAPFLLHGGEGGKLPSVFLSRDRFFTDSPVPPPAPAVYSVDEGLRLPRGISLPFLSSVPSEGEADFFEPGTPPWWYCRLSPREGGAAAGKKYYRLDGPYGQGEDIGQGKWQEALTPEDFSGAPPFLAEFLSGCGGRLGSGITVSIVSPSFAGARVFSGKGGPDDNRLFSGYYADSLAVIVSPEGRGFIKRGGGRQAEMAEFNLPALPENFVYTGVAFIGDAVAASWEEQQDLSVGAAGIMVQLASSP
jgi:hypothetical protein